MVCCQALQEVLLRAFNNGLTHFKCGSEAGYFYITRAHSHSTTFLSSLPIYCSLFCLGAALNGLSDRKDARLSAGRIFYLLDRKSHIDPLSAEGKKLDPDS